jgi:hypothetical protein
VTEVGRQRRDLCLHVLPRAIPTEQGSDREGVPQVVQPWRAVRTCSDTGVVDELPVGLGDHGIEQPFPGEGHEEARPVGPRRELVAQPGVTLQRSHAAGRQRHQPGLAELRLADQQHTLGPVDVATVELDRLPDPHPAGREQPDQRDVGGRPQRRDDRTTGLADHSVDVGRGVDERPAPPLAVRHQPQRRHLGGGVDTGQIAGEATDGGHPPRPDARPSARLRLLGPRQRRLDRHGSGPAGIEIGDEARQQPPGLGQFVSQRTTQPQVVDESLLQRAHRAAPGHGWATCRSASRSTLA